MFSYTDPIIIKNNKAREEWNRRHPFNNWKTGYSDEAIKELLADGMKDVPDYRGKEKVID